MFPSENSRILTKGR